MGVKIHSLDFSSAYSRYAEEKSTEKFPITNLMEGFLFPRHFNSLVYCFA